MTATETARIELHAELAEAIGPVATKLMQQIPPDWTQLATKTDLATLGTELRGEMAGLCGEIKAMEGRLDRRAARDLRTVVLTLTGFGITLLGLTVTLIVSGALTAA